MRAKAGVVFKAVAGVVPLAGGVQREVGRAAFLLVVFAYNRGYKVYGGERRLVR